MGRIRRACVAVALFACAALVVPASAIGDHAADALVPDPPNVLVIVTDDQRLDGTMIAMPRTLELFDDGGTEFTAAYTATPLCCPARGTIWSGRFAHNHGVTTNRSPDAQQAYDQSKTLQAQLRSAGYVTAVVGKYWNDWPLSQAPPRFDRYATMDGGYVDAEFNVDGTVGRVPGYSTSVIATLADDFLTDFEADDDRPWYLYVTPHAPHGPLQPEARYATSPFPDLVPSPAFTEADRSDKPLQVRNFGKTYSIESIDMTRKPQLRTLMSVDDAISALFARLDSLGETNTIAVFTSDNGWMWGEHGLVEKRWPYEDSIRIPLYVRWPGHVAAGADVGRLVSHTDIAPTIYDLVGVAPSYEPDGASVFSPGERDRLHLEHFLSPDKKVKTWSSTVTPTSQYVEWYENGSIIAREFYDLVADPYQLTNLLGDRSTANDPNVAPLHAQLIADQSCAGATCPRPAPTVVDITPPTAPGTPSGTSSAPGQVELTWRAATDDVSSTLTYRVYRDGSSSAFATVTSASTTTVSFTDTGLAGGSTHTYVVAAVDGRGNVGPRSEESGGITVLAEPPAVFADGFSAGFTGWTTTAGLTLDSANGTPAPSARAQVTNSRAYAYKALGTGYSELCVTADLNVASVASGQTVALLRLMTSSTTSTARIYVTSARALRIKNDLSGAVFDPTTTLPTGWHELGLCSRTGTDGQVRLTLDGVLRATWATGQGTAPLNGLQVLDAGAKTFTANVDDVAVRRS